MTSISHLIQRAKHEQNLSYQQMTARTAGRPTVIARSTMSNLVHHQLRTFPLPETIKSLAVALDVPVSVVMASLCVELGLSLDDEHPPTTPSLT
jgi:hypothetical protein